MGDFRYRDRFNAAQMQSQKNFRQKMLSLVIISVFIPCSCTCPAFSVVACVY